MKFLKYILLFIFISIFTATFAQQFWIKQNNPTTQNLRRVFFLDSLQGWAIGDSGTIIHTTNKGQNWVTQNSQIKSFFTSVFFLNERLGWATAWSLYTDTNFYGTILLKTTNGGTIWDSTRYQVSNIYLKSVFFIDSLTGFMAGAPANFLKTTNAGTNWYLCQTDSINVSQFPVNGFCFFNKLYGFAYGGVMDMGGIVWKTTNGGEFWNTMVVASEPISKIVMFDSLNLIGIGGDFEYGPSVIRTRNSGENWAYRSLEMLGVANSLSFRTRENAWSSLGGMMKLIYTTDTGKSWTAIDTPDSTIINDLMFTDRRNGYAVGDNGIFCTFNPESVGIIENKNVRIPSDIKLYQNYPNPFNPVTHINYSINHPSKVIIKIYDLLGKEILTIYQGNQKEGYYEYQFNGENLSSGVYFYRLITESLDVNNNSLKIETRKMILLK